jgi:predicted dehydrogenase
MVSPARVRSGAILQSVAARDEARAREFAEAHGFKRHDASYESLVAADDIDVVYNALPINLHAEWSIRALQAGKHVICEKPFAMNVREAAQVQAAARLSGKRVIEAFHYRYHPGFLQTLAWVDAGEIGLISSIDATFNVAINDRDGTEIRHLPETGGGAFMDLGCYPLSWALNLLRTTPVHIEAKASLTPRGVDESMEAVLTFPGAVRARLSASMAPGEAFVARLHVKGSKGEILFVNPLAPHHGGVLTLTAGSKRLSPRISRISTYTWQLDTILFALEAQVPLPTEGDAVIMQQEVLDGIYAAAGLKALRYP